MPFWSFKRGGNSENRAGDSSPTAQDLRTKLFAAADSSDMATLRKACRKWGKYVAPHVDSLAQLPDDVERTEEAVQSYGQRLQAIAVCLDEDCGHPELLDRLATPQADPNDPLGPITVWLAQLERRTARMEYEALIEEGQNLFSHLDQITGESQLRGRAMLHTRLGDLYLNSGRIDESIPEYEAALATAKEAGNAQWTALQLSNLIEARARIGRPDMVEAADELKALVLSLGHDVAGVERRVAELQTEEPVCRIVCIRDQRETDVEAIQSLDGDPYEFQYRWRNRPLHKVQRLTEQAKDLVSAGEVGAAVEAFFAASEVDADDPEPVYQMGLCLLNAGRYDEAAEAFAEVEFLAPGWFGCRAAKWLADHLADGQVPERDFHALRTLEDGGIDIERRIELGEQAIADSPEFAPLHLALGNLCAQVGNREKAEATYRAGLNVVTEPDTETRLLAGLASVLPIDSAERSAVLAKARNPNGNLLAAASTHFMTLPRAA